MSGIMSLIDLLLSNGFEANILHVGAHLLWHLFKNLFREISSLHGLSELNKLHNVASTSVAIVISEETTIAIKFLHGTEVCTSDPNDNHRCW